MSSQLSSHHQPSVVEEMQQVTLPSRLEALVDEYEAVTSDRDALLWQWLYYVFPRFRLSTVPERHADAARNAKFCFSYFMTVLDDLSERHLDRETFQEGRKIPFESTSCRPEAPGVDQAHLGLLEASWVLTETYLAEAPRHEEFRELLEFDLRQSLNTMDYNRLVNQAPRLSNSHGVEHYDTHNMLLYVYVDIDLAFSPGFDGADLAPLREVTWEAQTLARIGNWVTTWRRELDEEDYTSAVVTEAIRRGVVSVGDLQDETVSTDAIAARIRDADIERELLLRWNTLYGSLVTREFDTTSVDVHDFIDGMRHLLEVDVKARGLK
jgi:hypothetical protein